MLSRHVNGQKCSLQSPGLLLHPASFHPVHRIRPCCRPVYYEPPARAPSARIAALAFVGTSSLYLFGCWPPPPDRQSGALPPRTRIGFIQTPPSCLSRCEPSTPPGPRHRLPAGVADYPEKAQNARRDVPVVSHDP